ncbi:STM4011 family radical SAM protein [Frigoriglobus tundricola]|uniref:Inner membrane protein n=1 Tax=Frigoriglobus tundricola TaxID=2774151 RepID=A0A6M5YR79_9BACT|nr:STM4011 family radical SAM protein [Frigoriglobus tundricola]QJW96555.1 Putative inner membrane protein [Frigoriglobus tundricola]
MNLSILYRGPLSSCNYGCDYCPFAKHTETAEELAHDRACLERFVAWAGTRGTASLGVLFTPWGEALVRKWYQSALAALTRMPHVTKAAIQTNLSCKLDWVEECDKAKLALWCTFHPSETTRERFLAKCRELLDRGVRFSVGVVGLKEHFAEIEALRRELPSDVYLWVNAYKRGRGKEPTPSPSVRSPALSAELLAGRGKGGEQALRISTASGGLQEAPRAFTPLPLGRGAGGVGSLGRGLLYYTPEMVADLTRIDPLFPVNDTYHASRGEACRAGQSVISVDGDGTVRRCHFIKEPIGNIYAADFDACLRERPCTNDTCGCHIGYVHLDRLKLYDTFGDGVLERIPLGYR